MLKFLKDKFTKDQSAPDPETDPKSDPASPHDTNSEPPRQKVGLFTKIKSSLFKTRQKFTDGLANLFLGKKTIDAELLDELETLLLSADVGIDTTNAIIEHLTQQIKRKDLQDPAVLATRLKSYLTDMLKKREAPIPIEQAGPFVILMVGVNGAGKTTTIGKLAKHYTAQNKSVLLAAGDTFRAAAIEQLQVWGSRNDIPVIAQQHGADSASVIFDAVQAAKARNIDIVIADTAGRLHTQDNLMAELEKICRVLGKLDVAAPHETLLVLDAGIGQNALNQAQTFHDAIGVSGLVLTKLDGTAKGGTIFAIANQLALPIRFIGMGEQLDDLKPFAAEPFVEALFETTAAAPIAPSDNDAP